MPRAKRGGQKTIPIVRDDFINSKVKSKNSKNDSYSSKSHEQSVVVKIIPIVRKVLHTQKHAASKRGGQKCYPKIRKVLHIQKLPRASVAVKIKKHATCEPGGQN